MKLATIAKKLKAYKENIILIYAFNATGKTRLSVEYKNLTKTGEQHTGVYYNAFSEDIFVWDNDIENNEKNIRLTLKLTSLNKFHSALTEGALYKNLEPFNPKYDFKFELYKDNPESGIEYINFSNEHEDNIKISRGEERIFVWCFFLTLFEIEDLFISHHFFVDDPVSSLDDYNLFVTVSSFYNLIEKHYKNRKFIITTHHFGFFSVLDNWLRKGGEGNKFNKSVRSCILTNKSGEPELKDTKAKEDVFLFHLYLMQILKETKEEEIQRYHFAILRQLLENISSFLGTGRFSYVLEQIGIDDTNQLANIINTLSHQKVYQYQSKNIEEWELKLFKDVIKKIESKYNFILHTG